MKQRLELHWIGKYEKQTLEPRILVEKKVFGDVLSAKQNLLIKGDNLLALKALESEWSGKVKCIYIDPPYNTGNAFTQYEDGVEHSIWLNLMKARLENLHRLLSNDGSIWISIDDNECHYLKILLDETFGRTNFVATIIWQKNFTVKNSAKYFSDMHDYILVYAKNKETWNRNMLPRTEKMNKSYTNPDDDPRGPWTTNAIQARNYYSKGSYKIVSPSGKEIYPPKGTYWRVSEENFQNLQQDNRVWWGAKGDATPRIKKFLSEAKEGVVPSTMWFHEEAGHNAEAKIEARNLFADSETDVFLTPKPEKLIKRILEIATHEGDYVLDSFAGSGTTGAVAHKMNRKWIMIEMGEHCDTHIVPRMNKVVSGVDQGGVSGELNWVGGGGYSYSHLAKSLLEKDFRGNWVISKEYDAEMLSRAVCKHEGFSFAPDEEKYWKQGFSTEKDFIFVTTQFLNTKHVDYIVEQMKPDETLLICAKSFKFPPSKYRNITVKKIPQMLLGRCEFGRDDYSLNIAEPTQGELGFQ